MQSGLNKIIPDARDYNFVPSFGATVFDTKGLPENFSQYDGRFIPNQEFADSRFSPPLIPLPYGCTGESTTFDAGLQDGTLYNPVDAYLHTPPGTMGEGRDMRAALKTMIDRGPQKADGTFGKKRIAYFNVYSAGAIDDFDAARIALWINQGEKRNVIVGTFWYPEFAVPNADGTLPDPSYNTSEASLHCHLITGWKTINGKQYLESASWQGPNYGKQGLVYFSREQYNKLLNQPYTGAFTITEVSGQVATVGMKAYVDILVAFIRALFNPGIPVPPPEDPIIPPNNMLNTFCLGIRSHEGWTLNPPSKSVRNNNPGNCKFSSVGYLPIYEPVKKDSSDFAIFKDYETGFLYLKNLVKEKVRQHPSWDFYDFFYVYAPPSDNNDPKRYAEAVAKSCGVSPVKILSDLF